MGMSVDVLKNPKGDFTINGISSRSIELCIVNVRGYDEPSDTRPAALLLDNGYGNPAIFPAIQNEAGEWVKKPAHWMFGGNVAYCADSRFSAACNAISKNFMGGVYIFDRREF